MGWPTEGSIQVSAEHGEPGKQTAEERRELKKKEKLVATKKVEYIEKPSRREEKTEVQGKFFDVRKGVH